MFSSQSNAYCKVFAFLAALVMLAGLSSATITVNLNAPANLTNTTNGTTIFNFTGISTLNTTMNCSLYINGALNISNTSTVNNTATNFTLTGMANGIYNWNVSCTNGSDNGTSGVRVLTIDSTAPVLTINSPANNTNTSNTGPTFNWTAADALRTTITCNLTIDGAVNRSGLSVTNGTAYTNTATSAFSQGKHSWSVACWDDLNNTNISGTYNFTIDTTAPVINSLSILNLTNTSATLTVNASDVYSGINNCTYSGAGSGNLTLTSGSSAANSSGVYTANLSGLTASTNYTAVVNCYDRAGYLASNNTSFTTSSGVQVLGIDLGTAGNFVILAETTVTLTGTTSIAGDVGISPNGGSSLTGFSQVMDSSGTFSTSSKVNGSIYAADYAAPTPAMMTTAVNDMLTAYNNAAGKAPTYATELYSGDISGKTLAPGVYKWSTNVLVNTDVTLSGSATDVWVFETSGNLITASSTHVILSGGAQAKNVYWQVGGSTGATLGTYSTFNGNILSAKQIVVPTGAALNGKALAQTQVTMDSNTLVDGNNIASSSPNATSLTIVSPAAGAHSANTTLNITIAVNGSINTTTLMLTNSSYNSSSSATYGLINSTNNSSTGTYGFLWTVPAEGVYTITAVTYDLINGSIAKTRLTTVDTTAPVVTLNTPNSTWTANNQSSLNFTSVDVVSATTNCSLFIDGALYNSSVSANRSTPTLITPNATLTEGAHTWYVNCTDSVGNAGTSTPKTINIDKTAPAVSLVTPNNTWSTTATPAFAFNYTDASTNASCTLFVGGIASGTSSPVASNANATITSNVSLNQGNSSWYVNCTDLAGNTGNSSNRTILVDSIAPAVTIQSPADNMQTTVDTTSLSYTVSDNNTGVNISSCTYQIDSGAAVSITNCSNITLTIPPNMNTITVSAADNAGNIGSSTVSYIYNPPASNGGSNNGGGSGGSGSSGGSGGSSASSSQYASSYTLNTVNASCTVQVSRSIDSSTTSSTITTTLVNEGGDGCTLSGFVFTDTIPSTFANMSDITFSTPSSSQSGQTVSFSFPSFAPGESKTLSYSVSRWAKTSSVSDFTTYTMSAKPSGSAVPVAPQQNATAPVQNTAPASTTDSHGCIISAGYAWCGLQQRCLGASVPCTAPAAATNNTAPATAAPAQQTQGSLLPLAIAAIIVVAILALGAAALGLFGKPKKGPGR